MSRTNVFVVAVLLAGGSLEGKAQGPASPPKPGQQSDRPAKPTEAAPAQEAEPSGYEPDFSKMQPGLPPQGCRGNFVVGGKGLFYQGPRGSLTLPPLGIQKGFVVDVEYELRAGPNDRFVVAMQPKGFRGGLSIGVSPGGAIFLNGKEVARGKAKAGVNHLYLERLHGPQGVSFIVALNGEPVGALPVGGDPVPTVTLGALSTGREMWVGVNKLSIRWQK
jgi:hypothetical protein